MSKFSTIDIRLFSWGTVQHEQGDFTVDQEFFEQLNDSQKRLSKQNYHAPILKEHTPDGYSRGRVIEIYSDSDGIGVKAAVPHAVKKLIDDGLIDSWSPSFFTDRKDPHSDHVFKKVLRELSFVSIPYLKNVGNQSPFYLDEDNQQPSYSLSEYFLEEETVNMENEEFNVTEILAQIMEQINKITATLDELVKLNAPEEIAEENQEEDEREKEVISLRETVKTLTKDAVEASILTELGEVDESVKTVLHALSEGDRAVMITTLKSTKTSKPSSEVGNPGLPANPPKSELFNLCETAKKNGVKRGSELLSYLSDNGQDIASLDFTVIGKIFN